MHTYILTFIHSFIHAFQHSFIYTNIHSFIHTYILTFIHSNIHSFIHSYSLTFIHSYIHTYIYSNIHSFRSPSHTGPEPLPKPFLHTVRSSASSFTFQYPLLSLRSSSSFSLLLPRLPFTSSFYLPFNDVFQQAVPTQDVTNPVSLPTFLSLYAEFLSTRLYATLLHFSHVRSTWSSQSFSRTTFQNFPGISDLLSEVSKFRNHANLYSKRRILLFSYLYFESNLLVERGPFLLNAAFVMTILY